MNQSTVFCLAIAQFVTLIGLGVIAHTRIKRDPKIGKPIFSRRDSRGLKPVLFAVHVGLMVISLQAVDFPTSHAIVALYGAFMLTWLAPGAGDFGFGETGLYQGWVSRRFDQFDAWQLGREQLRLRVAGRWMAVEIPREKYGELRSALRKHVPDREAAPEVQDPRE